MGRFTAWMKKWWWTLLLALAGLSAMLFFVFRKPKQNTAPAESFSTKARSKIVDAETEAKIERLKAESDSGAKKAKLDEIKKIDDGTKRRVELAKYLDGLL